MVQVECGWADIDNPHVFARTKSIEMNIWPNYRYIYIHTLPPYSGCPGELKVDREEFLAIIEAIPKIQSLLNKPVIF